MTASTPVEPAAVPSRWTRPRGMRMKSPGPASALIEPPGPYSTCTRPDRTWRYVSWPACTCQPRHHALRGPHGPGPRIFVGERLAPVHPGRHARRQPELVGMHHLHLRHRPASLRPQRAAPATGASIPRRRLRFVGDARHSARPSTPNAAPPLPADDPAIFEMDLRGAPSPLGRRAPPFRPSRPRR